MRILITILVLSIVAFASNAPVILSVSIDYSANQITATGTNFSTTPTVVFGGNTLTIVSVITNQFTASLPTGLVAGTYKLSVTTTPGLVGEIAVQYGSVTPALTFSTLCSLIPGASSFPNGNNIALASTGCDKIAFVSSQLYTGNFVGASGANKLCQGLANDAGLPGQYKSWIDGNGQFYSNVPYIQIDNRSFLYTGTPVIAENFNQLITGPLNISIVETDQQTQGNIGTKFVWTGQDETAYPTGTNCNNWTSNSSSIGGTAGDLTAIDSTWSNSSNLACNTPLHIYCFQQ